ncbi:MAG: hypothetical protein ABEL76_13385, partial [Bradymonadaceae bacterium]
MFDVITTSRVHPEGRSAGLACLVVLSIALAGCPTYKKKYSGTYEQKNVDPVEEKFHVKLDFFRFGKHARAILRYYEPDVVTGDAYGQQTFCTWTRAAAFYEGDRRFQLEIPQNARIGEGRLQGKIVGESKLRMALFDRQTGETILERRKLKRVDDEPSTE